jgi:hypothetical protein
MEVYDKEKTDDDLRSLTGISKDEEAAMDTRAHNSVAEDIAGREGLIGSAGSEASENGGGLYKGDKSSAKSGGVKNFLWGSRRKKQATLLGGGGLAGAITIIIFALITFAGPAEIVQLSHILHIPFSHSENTDSQRTKGLLRYARSGETGETRVGFLGSKIFGNLRTQLADAGITFESTDSSGRIKTVAFDSKKLTSKYIPELKGMSSDEQKAFLEQKFGLSTGSLSDVLDSSGKPTGSFTSADNSNPLDLKTAITVKDASIASLNDGSIVSAIKNRAFGEFFGIPSLFHPIKRYVSQPLENKISDFLRAKLEQKFAQTTEDSVDTAASNPTPTPVEEASLKAVKGPLSSAAKAAGTVLLFTGAMCLARSVARDIPNVNHALIVAPSMAHALSLISMGHQIENGQDVNTYQVSAALSALTDGKGQSVWAARGLDALSSPTNYSGALLPLDYSQGFSSSTTAAVINNTIGGGSFGGVVCSPAGLVLQFVGGVVLLFSGVFDDGASWGLDAAVRAGTVALTAVPKFIAAIGVSRFIEYHATQIFAASGVVPKQFAGALGGNLLAYGARAAANSGAISSGAVALSSTASNLLSYQEASQANATFQSKSLTYKIFNPDDSKTVAGHIVDNVNPNISQNVSNVATSMLNFSLMTNMFKNIGTLFSSKVGAANNQPFDWGFPQYAIPDSILNNPAYEDPYANANIVAKDLDNTGGMNIQYIPKVLACFGDDISQVNGLWTVTAKTDVNPTSDSYLAGDCGNLNDPNYPDWPRFMLFIEDSRNMDSASCFVGGADSSQSCTNSGFGNGNASN